MILFMYFLLLLHSVLFGQASPIISMNAHQNNSLLSRDLPWDWKLEDLNNEFKGILWDHAFKDCTRQQLDTLIFAMRGAMWMLELPVSDGGYTYTAAWNRYFGDYNLWLKNGFYYLGHSTQIQGQIKVCLIQLTPSINLIPKIISERLENTQSLGTRQAQRI